MTWENGYGREWTSDVDLGRTRIRYGLTTERGIPVEFLVQLEYRDPESNRGWRWNPDAWYAVARFDHERDGPAYRDIEETGLHLDVLRPDGTQLPKRHDFPPVQINQAMRYADDYLRHHHDFLIERFVRWL